MGQGGVASLLRGGAAFESQARYSPDGKKIIFTRHGHHLLSFLNDLCLFIVIVIIFFVWLYLRLRTLCRLCSDLSGCDNVWEMELATSTSRQLTEEPFHSLRCLHPGPARLPS